MAFAQQFAGPGKVEMLQNVGVVNKLKLTVGKRDPLAQVAAYYLGGV
jgi:hypothetical protein